MTTFDPYDPARDLRIAQADKTKPLRGREGPRRATTCALAGCPIDEHSWIVTLPNKLGVACTGCAADRGWEIR